MNEILALSLQSMQQDMERVDYISNNVANIQTGGYKRQVAASLPVGFEAANFGSMLSRLAAPAQGAGVPATAYPPLLVQTDATPGTLKSTGESLDLALGSDGYFEISSANGPVYTRQGSFHTDARGRLVNQQGLPVMGTGGEIYLTSGNPVIDTKGHVFEAPGNSGISAKATAGKFGVDRGGGNQRAVAQIKVVQMDPGQPMQHLGNGLMHAADGARAMKEADIQVRQGYLENANVNLMQEMVQLMQTMRHFESMQKATMGYDDMMTQAVRKLGELN